MIAHDGRLCFLHQSALMHGSLLKCGHGLCSFLLSAIVFPVVKKKGHQQVNA